MQILNKPNTISVFKYLLFLIITVSLSAQVTERWDQVFSTPTGSTSYPTTMAVDSEGNIIVGGRGIYPDIQNDWSDWIIIKYSSKGEVLWSKLIDKNGFDDHLEKIVVDSQDNIIAVGRLGENFFEAAKTIIKFNSDGVEQWRHDAIGGVGGRQSLIDVVIGPTGQDPIFITGYVDGSSYDEGDQIYTERLGFGGNRSWVNIYNGTGNGEDRPTKILVDRFGNTIVTGWSMGTGGVVDYITIKYDQDGNEVWVSRYGGTGGGDDVATGLGVGINGEVYVTGYSRGGGGIDDFTTIKYNANTGAEEWVRRYYDPNNNGKDSRAWDLVVDRNGDILITGDSSDDFATVKYNSAGDLLWVKRYDPPSPFGSLDDARQIKLDLNNNVYVTGYSQGFDQKYDLAVVKYDTDGNEEWVSRLNLGEGGGFGNRPTFQLLDEDYFYVSGSYGPTDIALAAYMPSVQTNNFEASSNYFNGTGVACNSQELAVPLWNTWENQPCSGQDGLITNDFSSSGSQSLLILENDDVVRDLFNKKSGKWYINFKVFIPSNGNYSSGSTGGSFGFMSQFEPNVLNEFGISGDFLSNETVRLVTPSNSTKTFPYNKNTWNQVLLVVDLDNNNMEFYFGNLLLLNQIYEGPWTSSRNATMQLAGIDFWGNASDEMYIDDFYFGNVAPPNVITSVEDEDESIPTDFSLLQNYPNPFNPSTKIEFSIPKQSHVSLKVYDVLGREVAELINREMQLGLHSVNFDASGLSTGIYFYKIEAGNYTEIKKMSMIK